MKEGRRSEDSKEKSGHVPVVDSEGLVDDVRACERCVRVQKCGREYVQPWQVPLSQQLQLLLE